MKKKRVYGLEKNVCHEVFAVAFATVLLHWEKGNLCCDGIGKNAGNL